MKLEKNLTYLAVLFMPMMDSPLFPFNTYLRSFSIIIILTIFFVQISRGRLSNHDPRFNLAIVLLIFVNFVHTSYLVSAGDIALDTGRLIRGIFELIIVYILHEFFLGKVFLSDKREKIFRFVLISFLIFVVPYSIVQILASNNFFGGAVQSVFFSITKVLYVLFHSGDAIGLNSSRIYASYTEPSTLSLAILLVYLPLTLSLVINKNYIFKRKLFFLRIEHYAILASFIIIYFSFSRTGFGMMSVLLICALFIYYQKQKGLKGKLKMLLMMIVLFSIIGTLVLLGLSQSYVNMLGTLTNIEDNYSNVTRYAGLLVAWEIFLKYPFFGIGLNQFYQLYNQFLPSWAIVSPEVVGYVHKRHLADAKNILARLLSETGLFGFLLFCYMFFGRSMRVLFLKKWNEQSYLKDLAILCSISLFMSFFSVGSFVFPEQFFALASLSYVYRMSKNDFKMKKLENHQKPITPVLV